MGKAEDPWAFVAERRERKLRADRIAGSVTIALGLLLLAYLFVLKSLSTSAVVEKRFLYVSFPEIAGLAQGDPVRLEGVQIGNVESIRLRGNEVLVVLAVKRSAPIGSQPRFRIAPASVLGGRFVEIERRGEGQPPEGRVFSGSPPVDILNEVARFVNELGLGGPPEGGLLSGISKIGEELSARKGLAGELLSSKSELAQEISTVTKALGNIRKRWGFLFERGHPVRSDIEEILSALNNARREDRVAGVLLALLNKSKSRVRDHIETVTDALDYIGECVKKKRGSTALFDPNGPVVENLRTLSSLLSGDAVEGLLPDMLSEQGGSRRLLQELSDNLGELQKKLGMAEKGDSFQTVQSALSALTGYFGFGGGAQQTEKTFLVPLYGLLRFLGVVEPVAKPHF